MVTTLNSLFGLAYRSGKCRSENWLFCLPRPSPAYACVSPSPVSTLHSGFLYPLLCRTPRRPAVT